MNKVMMMKAKSDLISAARILESVDPDDRELSEEARKTARILRAILREVKEARAKRALGIVGKAVVLFSLACSASGCGLFMRDFEIPGVLKLTFPEGIDIHAGTNSIDRVDDRRGVSPIVEQRAGMTNKKY